MGNRRLGAYLDLNWTRSAVFNPSLTVLEKNRQCFVTKDIPYGKMASSCVLSELCASGAGLPCARRLESVPPLILSASLPAESSPTLHPLHFFLQNVWRSFFFYTPVCSGRRFIMHESASRGQPPPPSGRPGVAPRADDALPRGWLPRAPGGRNLPLGRTKRSAPP